MTPPIPRGKHVAELVNPPWTRRAADAIEGLIPRDGAIDALVHAGFGLAASAGSTAWAVSKIDDDEAIARDPGKRLEELRTLKNVTTVGAAMVGPLVLTAGMMAGAPYGTGLKPGISANYFLAAGGVLGAAWISSQAYEVLAN